MRKRALRGMLAAGIAVVGIAAAARGDDFWKHKPAAQWSQAEALKIVRHSPWARVDVVVFLRREQGASYSVPTGTKHCDADAIDPNGKCIQKGKMEAPIDSSQQIDAAPLVTPSAAFLVRWESSGPVSEAFARLETLGQHGVAGFQAQAPRVPADRYVITVKLEQPGRAGFEPFGVTPAGRPALLATLKTRRGVVTPQEIEFTGTGATSAVHFYFPRTLDGAPLLGEGRTVAEFNLRGPGYAVHSKFSLDSEFLR